jgi:hypothetical protein
MHKTKHILSRVLLLWVPASLPGLPARSQTRFPASMPGLLRLLLLQMLLRMLLGMLLGIRTTHHNQCLPELYVQVGRLFAHVLLCTCNAKTMHG